MKVAQSLFEGAKALGAICDGVPIFYCFSYYIM
jgi:hypothetical protein